VEVTKAEHWFAMIFAAFLVGIVAGFGLYYIDKLTLKGEQKLKLVA